MVGIRKGWSVLCPTLLPLACCLLCTCSSRGPSEPAVRRAVRPMMGTLVEVVWRAEREGAGAGAVRSTLDRMESLASRMSLYDPASELSRVNASAGLAPVEVSGELLDLIQKALAVSRMTGGAFDATVGSVEAVWGDIQREGGGRLPGEEAVRDALERVGYERVRVDPAAKTVFLEKAGMRLDLGGIAKGYITDMGVAWLKGEGVPDVLINAGGDIRVSSGAGSRAWRVGVRDPLKKDGLLALLSLREGAVVTSGTYERYFEQGEKRFAHIMDPKTGRPVEGLLSVTVVADDSFLADALATAVMVTGRKDGIALLGRISGVRGVLVERDGTVWIPHDLKDPLDLAPLPSAYAVRFYGAPLSSFSLPGLCPLPARDGPGWSMAESRVSPRT